MLERLWPFAAVDAVVGCFAYQMARLTPRGVQLGVRVPHDHQHDEILDRATRRYRAGVLGAILATLALLLLGFGLGNPFLPVASLAVLIGGTTASYVGVRQWLRTVKVAEGWRAEGPVTVAGELTIGSSDRNWFWWAIPAVALWLLFTIWGAVLYPSLPSQLPTHFAASGSPDAYSPKSVGAVFTGEIVGAIVLGLLLGIAARIGRSRSPLDPVDPRADSARQSIFRARMVRALLMVTAAIQVTIGVASLLVWQVVSPGGGTWSLVLAPLLIGLVGVSVVAYRSGQLGAKGRPLPDLPNAPPLPPTLAASVDDDRFWKGGVLYYNAADSSLLVPKRFGVGWTVNFANPIAWLFIVGPLAVVLVSLFLARGV